MTIYRTLQRKLRSQTNPVRNIVLFLLGVTSLLANPSWGIGDNSTISTGQILFGLAVILGILRLSRACPRIWMIIALPIVVCGAFHASSSAGNVDLNIIVSWVVYSSVMMIGVEAARDDESCAWLIKGVMVGIAVNCVVSAVQYVTMPKAFPLWPLYQFSRDQERVAGVAQAFWTPTQIFPFRVFGLFDEPSDMTASICPWLAFILALRVFPFQKGALRGVGTSSLALLVLLLGTAMIVVGRSGELMFFAPAMLLMVMWKPPKVRGPQLRRTGRRLLLVVLVAACVAGGVAAVRDRASTEINDAATSKGSWNERSSSIQQAVDTWLNPPDFGVVIGRGAAGVAMLLSDTGLSISSIIVKSLLMYGLVMAVGWVAIAVIVVNSIRSSRFRLGGLVTLTVLVFGLTVITSNQKLMGPWIIMGLLTRWKFVFHEEEALPALSPVQYMAAPELGFRPLAKGRN